MPHENFHQHSGHTPTPQTTQGDSRTDLVADPETEQQRLERLSQEVQALKQASDDAKNYRREVRHLRGRLSLLTGVSLAAIAILVTLATWLGFSLKTEQEQLAEQVRSATEAKRAGTEQIESLEDQISSLRQQARSLSQQAPEAVANELQGVQDRLKDLETQIREIATNAAAREQIIETLERTLQSLNQEEGSSTPAPAPDSSSTDPSNPN